MLHGPAGKLITMKHALGKNYGKICKRLRYETELNCRPAELQSAALPLSYRTVFDVLRVEFNIYIRFN